MDGRTVSQVADLFPYFPNLNVLTREANCPCPFCAAADERGELYEKNGIQFRGEDRLILRFHDNTGFCRVCATAGRGHNGNYYLDEIVRILQLDFHVERTQSKPKPENPLRLWTQTQVDTAHISMRQERHKKYFKGFGWSDEIIEKFKLGYGTLYQEDGAAYLIPMQLSRPDGVTLKEYYMEARQPGADTKHSMGSSRQYFWWIDDNPEGDSAILTEGAKDGISAKMMGFDRVAVSFDVLAWSVDKIKFLAKRGVKKLLVAGDNDEEGRRFSALVVFWARKEGIDAYALQWDKSFKDGFDLSDLLYANGYVGAKSYCDTHRYIPEAPVHSVSKGQFVQKVSDQVDGYKPAAPSGSTFPLAVLRGSGDLSMASTIGCFLSGYAARKRGDGGLLLMRAAPGAGKTYTLVKTTEKVAIKLRAEKALDFERLKVQRDFLRDELAAATDDETRTIVGRQLERIVAKIDEFSYTTCMWLAQFRSSYDDLIANGASPDMWFDWQARNAENCQNFDVVNAMGEANNNIGEFCRTHCRFKEQCLKGGYLSQDAERRKKPITVFRHQHLAADFFEDYHGLIVVDESPLHVFEEPLLVKPNDVYAHEETWAFSVHDSEIVDAINHLADALHITLNQVSAKKGKPDEYDDKMTSGAEFLTKLDSKIRQKTKDQWTLRRCIYHIDHEIVNDFYQPNNKENSPLAVKPRLFDATVRVIADELNAWLDDPLNKIPSRLHLTSAGLEVYKMRPLQVRMATPVIVADATNTMPELYEAMWSGREVQTYTAALYNPNVESYQIPGSDYTRAAMMASLGGIFKTYESVENLFQLDANVEDIFGQKLNLKDIPWSTDAYSNPMFQELINTIRWVVRKHETLLVVTHKKLRAVLEPFVFGAYPELKGVVAFSHYNNVRGTNTYKQMGAVLLIGQYRMPYPVVWRRVQAWAALCKIERPIPYDFTHEVKAYHSQDQGYAYRTFTDEFARQYTDMVEESEMQQAAERIRPHATTDKKGVYVMASRPGTVQWISEVVNRATFRSWTQDDSKAQRLFQILLNAYVDQGKVLSRDAAFANFHQCYHELVSEDAFSTAYNWLLERFPMLRMNRYRRKTA